ncbi:myb/SANT-like DNA-binding domain-containing protein 4 [Mytilus edulis]|uniref:myb/SANT-like DNA-binding domain-containing protein 4 n=1 Tax=Mytilus edulis TaxID=6550 RepID=UPI0039EDF7D7
MSKKRSPNFTSQEIQILTDEVEKNKSLLFSRLTNTATNSAKKRGWEAVCSMMNAVNDTDHLRTVEEIRKKWTCYVSSTKKKLAENKRESSSSSSILQAFPLISSDDDDAVDDVIVTQDMPSSSKVAKLDIPTKKVQMENETLRLIEIENERLKVERERLQIERSRYDLEKDRYNLKIQKLEIEKEKLEMERGRRQQLQIAELCTTQPTLFQMSNPCVAINPSESSCDL